MPNIDDDYSDTDTYIASDSSAEEEEEEAEEMLCGCCGCSINQNDYFMFNEASAECLCEECLQHIFQSNDNNNPADDVATE